MTTKNARKFTYEALSYLQRPEYQLRRAFFFYVLRLGTSSLGRMSIELTYITPQAPSDPYAV
jgi:hypothetical protein